MIHFKKPSKLNFTHSTPSSSFNFELKLFTQDETNPIVLSESNEPKYQGELDGAIKAPARPEPVEGYEKANGFSFIEVTLTIAIIGMMITTLFSLQFGAFRNVTLEHAILSRIFYIRNIYFDPENFQKLQKDKTLTQDIAEPKMKMISKYSEVPEKSEIAKKFDNIYLIKSTGSWQGMQTEQQETLVGFVYVKPKEEKKTK